MARVLEVLRAAGYAPVAESPEGMVVLSRPDEHRLPPRTRPTRGDVPGLPPDRVEAAVRSLRRADEATRDGKPMLTTAVEIIAAVQDAVTAGGRLRIGYVNASGSTSDRIVAPISVGGGYFTAYDEQSDERRTFSIARVTGLATVPQE